MQRSLPTRLAVAVLGIVVLAFVSGTRADAATTTTTTDPTQAAAGWLATQFEDSTHLPTPTGDHFDSSYTSNGSTVFYTLYGQNADAIFGLAAAKAGGDKIKTAVDYLAANADDYADFSGANQGGPFDGSIAKMAVAAQVAGVSGATATSFGGTNLLAALKTDECTTTTPDGFGGFICVQAGAAKNIYASTSESLTILAEAREGGVYAPSTTALSYFDSLQCPSGGFTGDVSACAAGDEDIDSTSYAIMALSLLGPTQATHLNSAVAWLKTKQDATTGSFNNANTNSTGLAAAALASQGVNLTSARAWLASQQVPAGSPGAGALKYAGAFAPTTAGATTYSALATAQGLTGLATNGSLATLTATGATAGTSAFAPVSSGSSPSAVQGSAQTVTANGFAAGESVQVVLHSSPVTLGTATANASGSVSLAYTVPASLDPGAHTVTLTGLTSALTATSALTVTAAPAAATSTAPPSTTTTATTTTATTDDVLANTGTNGPAMRDLSVAAVGFLIAGFGLLLVARRRRA